MRPELIDNEAYFQQLKTRPVVAWPTVLLLLACWVVVIASWYFVLGGQVPLWIGCVVNCIAYYYLFAPVHDGLHRAIARNVRLNDAFTFLAVAAAIPMPVAITCLRMHHMQHHIHCGDAERDPDLAISSKGKNALSWWWIWGIQYFPYYRKYQEQLPPLDFRYLGVQNVLMLTFVFAMLYFFREKAVFLWLVPSLFMVWMIAFIFSYLPHHVHRHLPGQDPMDKYQSTCNRVGLEWLLTPLLQYQNYHLVHHLYPTVPFYRYIKMWNARRSFHASHRPAEVQALSNKPTRAG